MPVVAAVALPLFILLLPFLMLLLLVPGFLSQDEARLLRTCSPFLSPVAAVLWYIVLHRVVARRRSRYLHQFLVLVPMAVLMFMLIEARIYRIR
jgi:hypothetical protein